MLPRVRPFLFALGLVAVAAAPARADLTGFVGFGTEPATRPMFGVAGGFSLIVIGFEFEYMKVSEDLTDGAPSLRTGTGAVYVQNPIPVAGMQFYGIAAGGIYHESFEDIRSNTNVTTNLGGGVKIKLVGPLRLRLDYRVQFLYGDALYTKPQRFYAGLNLAF